MSGFLDDVRRSSEEQKAESHQAFVAKSVKRVCAFFGEDPGHKNADSEFGFSWFHDRYPGFPVTLEARRLKVDVGQMFKAITKSEPWTELLTYLDEHDVEHAGLIVPAYGQGLYVVHNWWAGPAVPGHTRLSRRGASGDKGIIFEELEGFLKSVKASGWSP